MKNWIGLLIALSLGIVACLLNWQYLKNKTEEVEMISFLAIKDGNTVAAGTPFLEDQFAELRIPRKHAVSLQTSAVLFRDRHTVASMKAIRDYVGGDIILIKELKTPPAEIELNPRELAMWVPVNASMFVSKLVKPGDSVYFVVPNPTKVFDDINEFEKGLEQPLGPEFGNDENFENPVRPEGFESSELVGPFRVISLGARLGSYEVEAGAGGTRARENTIGIAVRQLGNEKIDPNAEKLVRWMASPDFRQADVLLAPKQEDE